MPQIDKVTILSVIFWLSILYVFQYLLLSISHLQLFINSSKVKIRRFLYVIYFNLIAKRQLKLILFFPWVFDTNSDENL